MSRIFLDTLRANITAQIQDNTTGLITPALLRTNMLDSIDSLTQEECVLNRSNIPAATVSLTENWVVLAEYDGSIGGDATWLKPTVGTGTIELNAEPGWYYNAVGFVDIGAPQGDDVLLAVTQNGVPAGFIGFVAGRGVQNPYAVAVVLAVPANLANETIAISARSVTGGGNFNVDIYDLDLVVTSQPTNNPT